MQKEKATVMTEVSAVTGIAARVKMQR